MNELGVRATAGERADGTLPWHALQCAEVLTELGTSGDGLDPADAERLLTLYGTNQLSAGRRKSALKCFLLQFNQPLIYILLASAVITTVMGEWVDASVIFVVTFINAVIGYLQEQ